MRALNSLTHSSSLLLLEPIISFTHELSSQNQFGRQCFLLLPLARRCRRHRCRNRGFSSEGASAPAEWIDFLKRVFIH